MFFPEKITKIRPEDKVLEIGPGADPHPRSDVFLEISLNDDEAYAAQRGFTEKRNLDKPLFFYDGGKFPFNDYEFDYVICSHVIEHVADVESFVLEILRVSKGGYLEYPTIYYEYLYNFDVHLNFIKRKGDVLYYMPKVETPINKFTDVQKLNYHSLELKHYSFVNELKNAMFEGFEWENEIKVEKAKKVSDLCFDSFDNLM